MLQKILVVAGLVLGIITVVVANFAAKGAGDIAVTCAGLGVCSLAVAMLL